MSNKSLLNRFKKAPKPQPPRELSDIQKEYQQLSTQAGQNQYQAYVLSKDLERINQRLVEINQEAASRNTLNAEAKAKEADAASVESSAQ